MAKTGHLPHSRSRNSSMCMNSIFPGRAVLREVGPASAPSVRPFGDLLVVSANRFREERLGEFAFSFPSSRWRLSSVEFVLFDFVVALCGRIWYWRKQFRFLLKHKLTLHFVQNTCVSLLHPDNLQSERGFFSSCSGQWLFSSNRWPPIFLQIHSKYQINRFNGRFDCFDDGILPKK